ncbi:hypothetical protein GCM10012275_43190 [Longimycelium tulufanense]|uniref:Uncharacterized protein n=1 Tax=Longimycelium tulufanense TaxID=907463 RepID=A0A8J3FVG1_9PSEU|nr:hypothetical protein [Longimycelium tulufanense]GGM67998.1 hypothetical protein GCM10012275_43190 [Longimycelium tulufanense]
MADLRVDLPALRQLEEGVKGILAELREHSMHGAEDSAVGVLDLALSPAETGHEGLADAAATFLDRARWSLRGEVRELRLVENGLRDTRTLYQQVEDGMSSLFGKLGLTLDNPAGGSP